MAATKPTTPLPEWDTDEENLEAPPGQQLASGWAEFEPIRSDWVNYLWRRWTEWIKYLIAGRDGSDGYPYAATELPTFELALQIGARIVWDPPEAGVSDASGFSHGGTALPYDDGAVGGDAALNIGFVAIDLPFNTSADGCITITGFEVTYKKGDAGDVLKAQLIAVNPATNVGATVAQVDDADMATLGALAVGTGTVFAAPAVPGPYPITAPAAYYIRCEVTPVDASDRACYLATATITYTKTRVE